MKVITLTLNKSRDMKKYRNLVKLRKQDYDMYLKLCREEMLLQIDYEGSLKFYRELLDAVFFFKDKEDEEYAYVRIYRDEETWYRIQTVADDLSEHIFITKAYIDFYKEIYQGIMDANDIELKLAEKYSFDYGGVLSKL